MTTESVGGHRKEGGSGKSKELRRHAKQVISRRGGHLEEEGVNRKDKWHESKHPLSCR